MTDLFKRFSKLVILSAASLLIFATSAFTQAAPDKSKEQSPEKSTEKSTEPPNAAQLELLETSYRFEGNGDSRKEVHARVKINSELGVRQFARLNFDYNRSFQAVDIPLVHITHASGGTADILPSAITDNPNPAVVDFPAYQDVRIKSVRILGLQPGDLLEYRVITTTTKPPLAPDFWLEHSFDQIGVVTQEVFELNLPALPSTNVTISPSTPPSKREQNGEGDAARLSYQWILPASPERKTRNIDQVASPDITVTTFSTWRELSARLESLRDSAGFDGPLTDSKATKLEKAVAPLGKRVRAAYDFVSRQIVTADLPVGSTGYKARSPDDILKAGYATPEDKIHLLAALLKRFNVPLFEYFAGAPENAKNLPPRPSLFTHVFALATDAPNTPEPHQFWIDPGVEVAPFGMIPSQFRGKSVFSIGYNNQPEEFLWFNITTAPPFPSFQKVISNSTVDARGMLTTKMKYTLRGDNELLLRVTFHQTPPEKQREIAQYLALSDGFRGKVTSVTTSDPYATDAPFEVEYEITQDKFVDWAKKPVRIPALLPLPGLPETPKKTASGAKIELGPPLDIELSGTLRLPVGVTGQAPPGTSVKRDYATFSSEYSVKSSLIRFSRHLNFLASDIAGDRAVDLSAFVHAVQSDQSQVFILEKPEAGSTAKPK